jgi:hypothetical protein
MVISCKHSIPTMFLPYGLGKRWSILAFAEDIIIAHFWLKSVIGILIYSGMLCEMFYDIFFKKLSAAAFLWYFSLVIMWRANLYLRWLVLAIRPALIIDIPYSRQKLTFLRKKWPGVKPKSSWR